MTETATQATTVLTEAEQVLIAQALAYRAAFDDSADSVALAALSERVGAARVVALVAY